MRKFILLFLSVLALSTTTFAQVKTADAPPVYGWSRVGGIGLNLNGLGIKNPRVGAGLNSMGIGGLGTYAATRTEAKWYWESTSSIQLGAVRLGGSANPFQKSADVLRLTSKAGKTLTSDGKWLATGLLIGTTSILKTYVGNLLDGTDSNLFSKFLSPAQLQFHPGIEWRPNAKFSLLFSPIGLVTTYVGDDALAAKNIHGNEFGKNSRVQLTPALQANYKNKFFDDRVAYTSSLNLTTNYLDNPFVISALNFWQNNLSFMIYKGLSLDVFGEAAYDHNKLVQKDLDEDGILKIGDIKAITADGQIPATTGPDRLGRGTQFMGSFMLKYSKVF